MKLLLKECTIVHPLSSHNEQVRDILIENGIIKKIDKAITAGNARVVQFNDMHVAPGFFDIGANFCDPGLEHKEDLETGCKAAAAGGFTGVVVLPNTKPVADSKSIIEYWKNRTPSQATRLFYLGAVTKGTEGTTITEMYDMSRAGAIGFSDGTNSLQNDGVLLRALQYVKPFGGIILQHPDEKQLSENGLMNESETSVYLGMKGKPNMAESLMIQRNVELCRYAESKLHFFNVTTSEGIETVKMAQKDGVQVSAGISPVYFSLDDKALESFDSNVKMDPPLRTKKDILAIKKGIKAGTISCLSSWHQPQNVENKKTEFEYAADGIINLQTCFSLAVTNLGGILPLEKIIELLSINSRKIMGVSIPELEEGSTAELVCFNPNAEYVFTEANNQSKSQNSPFIGQPLKGLVHGVINQLHTNL